MADEHGVLVAGEIQEGRLSQGTTELLAHGRALADALGEELGVALLADDVGDTPKEAIAFGADKVYAATDPLLKDTPFDAYLAAMHKVCLEHPPRIVLLAKDDLGAEVAPRLAFRLDTAAAQDCLELRIDPADKRLIAERPVYGGSCVAAVTCSQAPMIAVVRGKTAEPLQRDDSRHGEVTTIAAGLDPSIVRTRMTEEVAEAAEGVRLEDASIIVAGGRGLGGPEPFQNELQALADALGASLGASRAVVDAGWVPYSHQIGLTGKTVTPDLYITVGISGASQHMAGCTGAKVIVAINKDAEANIFKDARYGIVGDWKKVLPALTKQVKELR
jgi:electron transfer flavoprotein alpha subunit